MTISCSNDDTPAVKPSPESPDRIKSVLIVGNSIVDHAPSPAVQWEGNWGMAASCQDSDFVHRIIAEIHRIDRNVDVKWLTIVPFETDYTSFNVSQLSTYRNSDIFIIKIGENVSQSDFNADTFTEAYDALLQYLAPTSIKIIVGGFWDLSVNNTLQEYAEAKDLAWVPLADLSADQTNMAIGLFENASVARHPSDQGMRHIADRIWKQIAKYFIRK
jgi:hypothetical protein